MELDQPKLQLIINVVAITTGTTLAMIWYLRQRDRQVLTNRLSSRARPVAAPEVAMPKVAVPEKIMPEQIVSEQLVSEQIVSEQIIPEQVVPDQILPEQILPEQCIAEPSLTQEQRLSIPEGPIALPTMNPDIRHFVTGRAQNWVAPSVTQWNQRLSGAAKADAVLGGHSELPAPLALQIVFPRQQPKPVAFPALAAPLQLCRSFAAAKYGN